MMIEVRGRLRHVAAVDVLALVIGPAAEGNLPAAAAGVRPPPSVPAASEPSSGLHLESVIDVSVTRDDVVVYGEGGDVTRGRLLTAIRHAGDDWAAQPKGGTAPAGARRAWPGCRPSPILRAPRGRCASGGSRTRRP